MRRLLAVLALIVVVASAVWGLAVMRRDVELTPANPDGLTCGGLYGSLSGRPLFGGENPYPDNWTDLCREAAREDVPWIVAPAVTGSAALLYLSGAFVMLTRRAKAEGRSQGAVA